MQPIHIDCFQAALGSLLGRPVDGAMAYIRSLDRRKLEALFEDVTFLIDGWSIFGVSDAHEAVNPWLATDRAVELRESRQGSTLLFVDLSTVGAGMDGIYSAAHEIKEGDLFDALRTAAVERLPHGSKGAVRAAVRTARRLNGRHMIGPWREFDFLAHCAARPEEIGLHVALLGLWPVGSGFAASEKDWEIAAGTTSRATGNPSLRK